MGFYMSQYDRKKCMTQDCFGDYIKFDSISRKCSICSVYTTCKQHTLLKEKIISKGLSKTGSV